MVRNLLQNKDRNYLVFSQVLNAALGLILGKIIAVYISPEDFGLFTLQFAIYTLIFSILITPFLQFIKATTKTLILKIGHQFYFYLVTALTLLTFLILYFVFRLTFLNSGYFFLLLFGLLISNIIHSLMSDYFNIYNLIKLFSINNLLKSIASLFLLGLFFFINYKYQNGAIVLWEIQLVGFVVGLYFFIKYYKYSFKNAFSISFNSFSKKYFKYAWPLMILAFWAWVNNYFDRYVIEYFLSLAEVGIYNANYALGSKFFLLLNPIFLTLLVPNIYSNSNKIEVKKAFIFKYAKAYTLISIPFLIVLYFSTNLIGKLLLSENYKSGFYLIFWIALAYFFLTLVYFYETIFYVNGKTKVILYSNIAAAIFNILLNILFIPLYGLNGAVIATLMSFIIRFFIVKLYYNKL